MSAAEVAERFAAEVPNGYGFAIVNYANPDMVGHTGVIPAVVEAVEATDAALGRTVAAVEALGGVCLITADHGNAEQQLEEDGVSPHTAHTTNPVPLVITLPGAVLEEDGALADLVPTCLWLMGIPPGQGMTGRNLVRSV
jgi:2,3-bisphosphoglycerate-independent phosphoglycerate mutase